MSLIKALMAQFGRSVTAANNFVLDASANNGTMRWARGNAGATTQDVLLVASDGKVDAPQGAKSAGSDVMRILQIPAKATVSGTFVDFSPADGSGIPAWAKEITINLTAVSTNGTSHVQLQLGAGAVQSAGYTAAAGYNVNGGALVTTTYTAGFGMLFAAVSESRTGNILLTKASGNSWVASHTVTSGNGISSGAGTVTLSDTLDRIRLTAVNGTDSFDAGSVSITVKG